MFKIFKYNNLVFKAINIYITLIKWVKNEVILLNSGLIKTTLYN